jgi:hypothetical protein
MKGKCGICGEDVDIHDKIHGFASIHYMPGYTGAVRGTQHMPDIRLVTKHRIQLAMGSGKPGWYSVHVWNMQFRQ